VDWISQLPALGALVVLFVGVVSWMMKTIDSLHKENMELRDKIMDRAIPALEQAAATQQQVVTALQLFVNARREERRR